jgi:transcriptional regulator with XRE-family HTH domain
MTSQELRRLRSGLGLTQAQLADKVGVTQNTVARWEIGLRRIPEPVSRLLARLKTEGGAKAKRRPKEKQVRRRVLRTRPARGPSTRTG